MSDDPCNRATNLAKGFAMHMIVLQKTKKLFEKYLRLSTFAKKFNLKKKMRKTKPKTFLKTTVVFHLADAEGIHSKLKNRFVTAYDKNLNQVFARLNCSAY